MRVKSVMAVQALDGLEAVGLDRAALVAAMGIDERDLADRGGFVEWSAVTAMLNHAWLESGEDVTRMRLAGSAIARAPSYALLQGLARTVVSVKRLYDVAARWGAPATFPHIPLEYEALSERRLRFRAAIPEPYAPSPALYHIFEGVLVETPTLVGLSRATIISSRVTPRSIDVVIDLPPSPSIGSRISRAFRAALYSGEAVDLLEEQRRELADALLEAQRSTAENRELLDRLPDLVMIHRDGVLLWLNRANVTALGYERSDELAGRPLLDLVEPASRALIRERMQLPEGAEVPELSEIRLVSRDGRIVVVEISPAQIVSLDGKPARLIVGRDVTERAKMQQQLLIADRMASIGLLAAGVAHEVNNPLGYVLNNIELAMKALAPLGDATKPSREVLGVALEGVDRIRTIVRDLLALSRVDEAAIGPVDVVAVVESTLALAGKNITDRAVLTFEHEPVGPAAGTVARLGQVLLNLISNALEAMHSHAREDNQLRVSVRPSGTGGAIVEVSDSGVGIPDEHARQIFEPFFTTKAPGKGTGLGLAISQRLVAEMGGLLSFESTPLRGSTFRVTLAPWEPPAPSTDVSVSP